MSEDARTVLALLRAARPAGGNVYEIANVLHGFAISRTLRAIAQLRVARKIGAEDADGSPTRYYA